MEAAGVNQVELARRTGIAISRINNYLYGSYRTIKPKHAGALAEAFGKDGAALVEAYLYDLLPAECRGLVEVKYPGQKTGKGWAVEVKGLDKEFAGQWEEFYRLCASSATVRHRTTEWIALMRETKSTKD